MRTPVESCVRRTGGYWLASRPSSNVSGVPSVAPIVARSPNTLCGSPSTSAPNAGSVEKRLRPAIGGDWFRISCVSAEATCPSPPAAAATLKQPRLHRNTSHRDWTVWFCLPAPHVDKDHRQPSSTLLTEAAP